MRPTYGGKSDDLRARLLGLTAVGLVLAVLIADSRRLEDTLRPHTGDVISFRATREALRWVQATITAAPIGNSPAVPCILDPQVMQASGGSLVIEATQFKPRLIYQVHWAGAHTSDTGADCGRSAELLLGPADILSLSLVASHRN